MHSDGLVFGHTQISTYISSKRLCTVSNIGLDLYFMCHRVIGHNIIGIQRIISVLDVEGSYGMEIAINTRAAEPGIQIFMDVLSAVRVQN